MARSSLIFLSLSSEGKDVARAGDGLFWTMSTQYRLGYVGPSRPSERVYRVIVERDPLTESELCSGSEGPGCFGEFVVLALRERLVGVQAGVTDQIGEHEYVKTLVFG